MAIPWPRRRNRETTPAKTTHDDVAQTIDRLRFLTTRLENEVAKFEKSSAAAEHVAGEGSR